MADYRVKVQEILTQLNQVILGKEIFIKNILEALLADGHILLEDLPGVGKTTMALAFSKILGLDWNRVQFTPDVMPSDLCGFFIYRKEKETFEYCPGAVFCNLLLADEINRTSPKTQSALLEAMEEKQVTVDGTTYRLPQPFFVIATQNPLDSVGTQWLPAAQMDRFLICLHMGYPDFRSEVQLAKELSLEKRTQSLTPLADAGLLLAMQQEVDQIYVQDAVILPKEAEEMCQIVQQAAFSNHAVSETQTAKVRKLYLRALKYAHKKRSFSGILSAGSRRSF